MGIALKTRYKICLTLAALAAACGNPPPQGGAGGTGGGGTGGAGPSEDAWSVPGAPSPSALPAAREECPTFEEGDMTFLGRKVRIWVDAAATNPGPVIFYWHGTLMDPNVEIPVGLGPALQDVVGAGGIVAGFYSEPQLACAGCAPGSIESLGTGNGVWFKKDFETADEVLACAIQQGRANLRHLHSIGMSAGGLQASAMAYERSNYLASVISYSGGKIFPVTRQDPDNELPVVLAHGGANDIILVNFKTQSELMANELKPLGHFIVLCDHGRGHIWPEEFGNGGATLRFFRSHPYKASPEPYAGGLPDGVPDYCSIF